MDRLLRLHTDAIDRRLLDSAVRVIATVKTGRLHWNTHYYLSVHKVTLIGFCFRLAFKYTLNVHTILQLDCISPHTYTLHIEGSVVTLRTCVLHVFWPWNTFRTAVPSSLRSSADVCGVVCFFCDAPSTNFSLTRSRVFVLKTDWIKSSACRRRMSVI